MTSLHEHHAHAPLPPALQRTMTPVDQVGTELIQLISSRILNDPRSLQVSIGPSEIGHVCDRRIGYKLLNHPENPGRPPNWKATVGSAIHTWMETMLDDDNLNYADRTGSGEERWYIEEKVTVGQINGTDKAGSCDVYDRVTGTVIDWKTCGPGMLTKYKKNGPGPGYRAQAHLYGRGWQNKGLPVRAVMIISLPRNGELRDAHIWSEPYNEQIALDALSRATGIDMVIQAFGTAGLDRLNTADAFCRMCPYYRYESTDLAVGCPGHPGGDQQRSRDQLLDLI